MTDNRGRWLIWTGNSIASVARWILCGQGVGWLYVSTWTSNTQDKRSSHFWDVTQRLVVFSDVSGQPIGPRLTLLCEMTMWLEILISREFGEMAVVYVWRLYFHFFLKKQEKPRLLRRNPTSDQAFRFTDGSSVWPTCRDVQNGKFP